ncbi:MAG: TrkA family potassium uptake protein [Acidimicrobiia bacterium]
MHVVVVGCGRVGSELASSLQAAGHTVAVIDKNPSAFKRLAPDFDGQRIVGFGFDRDHLIEAGIERADALAAVSNGDNSNILTARIARENFGIDRVIARIYDPRRALIYERLGISTVATVAWTTDQVLRKLTPADRGHDWIDPSGKIVLLERLLPDHWAGKRLEALEEPGQFWLGAMTRFGESFIPESKVVGQQGDVLYFTARIDAVATLDERLSSKEDHS